MLKSAVNWLSKKISGNVSEICPLSLPTWKALTMVYWLNLKYLTSMNWLHAEDQLTIDTGDSLIM